MKTEQANRLIEATERAETLESRKVAALERIAAALAPREVVKCGECVFACDWKDNHWAICRRYAPHDDSGQWGVDIDDGCAEGVRRECAK